MTNRMPNPRDSARPWRASMSVRGVLLGLVVTALALVSAGVTWGATTYDPATDANSMKNVTAYTGATAWWNAGYTGAGVDVAVIDTGVSPGRRASPPPARSSTAPISRSSRRRRRSAISTRTGTARSWPA